MRADLSEFDKVEELGKKYIDAVKKADINALKQIFTKKHGVMEF